MAKKNKTKRINMSKVKKFYQPKAGEANMNLEKLGLSVCDVWYSKKECQEAFPNEKIKKLKRKEVDFSPSFVDAPAGYKDIRKGKKK